MSGRPQREGEQGRDDDEELRRTESALFQSLNSVLGSPTPTPLPVTATTRRAEELAEEKKDPWLQFRRSSTDDDGLSTATAPTTTNDNCKNNEEEKRAANDDAEDGGRGQRSYFSRILSSPKPSPKDVSTSTPAAAVELVIIRSAVRRKSSVERYEVHEGADRKAGGAWDGNFLPALLASLRNNKTEGEGGGDRRRRPTNPSALRVVCDPVFRLHTWIRLRSNHIMQQKWFNNFIILCIVVNCILLAMDDPTREEPPSWMYWVDLGFTIIFVWEMLVKLIACGLRGYFTNGWNLMDFVIVVEGVYSSSAGPHGGHGGGGGGFNPKTLRTFRVMRPLRTVNKFPKMRVLVSALFRSVPVLSNIVVIFFFFLTIFALIGVLLWMDLLKNRCFSEATGLVRGGHADAMHDSYASPCCAERPVGVSSECGSLLFLDHPYECEQGEVCGAYSAGPHDGVTNFDNVGWAMLVLFQATTLEGWTEILHLTQDVMSEYTFVYFVVLVVAGSFALINLMIATILGKFQESIIIEKSVAERKITRLSLQQGGGGGSSAAAAVNGEETGASAAPPGDDDSDRAFDRMMNDAEGGKWQPPERLTSSNLATVIVDAKQVSKNLHKASRRRSLAATKKEKRAVRLVRTAANRAIDMFSALPVINKFGTNDQALKFATDESGILNKFVMFCIFVNVVVLAADGHGINDGTAHTLAVLNEVLMWIFFTEMVFKWVAMGGRVYYADAYNTFDCFIVLGSLVETFADKAGGGGSAAVLRLVRICRVFRVMRVARMGRYMKSMKMVVSIITGCFNSMISVVLILMLFMFIFSILGMQLFGGKLVPRHEGADKPRHHFDTFFWAFITIFQVLGGENWHEAMFDTIRATDSAASALFYILWILVGNYFLLNLILAVVLESSSSKMESERMEQMRKHKQRKTIQRMLRQQGEFRVCQAFQRLKVRKRKKLSPPLTKGLSRKMNRTGAGASSEFKRITDHFEIRRTVEKQDRAARIAEKWTGGGAVNELRRRCWAMVSDRRFDNLFLVLIIVSSATMTRVDGVSDTSGWFVVDTLCAVLFAVEVAVKLLAVGWREYIHNLWNLLDSLVVVSSFCGLVCRAAGPSAAGALEAGRFFAILRSVRPLRLVNRIDSLQVLLAALHESLVAIYNVLLCMASVWFVFAILAMQLFKGKFYSCNDPDFPEGASRFGEWNNASQAWEVEPCDGAFTFGSDSSPREWSNEASNFDNVGQSMLTMFILTTLEGWPEIMHSAIDGVDVDIQPKIDYDPSAFIFFFVFIVLSSFFFTNLFVGVVFENFMRAKCTVDGMLISQDQARWNEFEHRLRKIRPRKLPRPPAQPLRNSVWHFVMHRHFDRTVMFVIFLNAVVLAMQHSGQSSAVAALQVAANHFFSAFFLAEMLLKIAAFSLVGYCRMPSNWFDGMVTVTSVLDSGLELGRTCVETNSSALRLLRSLRVFRILRLARALPGLRILIVAVTNPLPLLVNVMFLLFLFMFVYANIGMVAFSGIDYDGSGALNRHVNFDSFFLSMQTCWAMATGENWNGIMNEVRAAHPEDWPAGLYEFLAIVFFVTFVCAMQFLMINLFVMVIVDSFEVLVNEAQGALEVQLPKFSDAWMHFDPNATGFIREALLPDLLRRLPVPMGVGPSASTKAVRTRICLLDLPQQPEDGRHRHMASFHDTIVGICTVVLGTESDDRRKRRERRKRVQLRMAAMIIIYGWLARFRQRKARELREAQRALEAAGGVAASLPRHLQLRLERHERYEDGQQRLQQQQDPDTNANGGGEWLSRMGGGGMTPISPQMLEAYEKAQEVRQSKGGQTREEAKEDDGATTAQGNVIAPLPARTAAL